MDYRGKQAMTEELLLSVETDFTVLSFVRMSRVFLLLSFLSCLQISKAGTRGQESDRDAHQMRELLYQNISYLSLIGRAKLLDY